MTEKKPRGRPRKNTYSVPARDQVKNPVGRPKTDIDLAELKRLCRLNCTMPEIAAFFEQQFADPAYANIANTSSKRSAKARIKAEARRRLEATGQYTAQEINDIILRLSKDK